MSANFHPLVYIIDYILGIIMWTLVGRVAMNIFQREDSQFFFMRVFVKFTNPLLNIFRLLQKLPGVSFVEIVQLGSQRVVLYPKVGSRTVTTEPVSSPDVDGRVIVTCPEVVFTPTCAPADAVVSVATTLNVVPDAEICAAV